MSFTKEHAEKFATKLGRRPLDNTLPRLEVREVTNGAHVMQQIWCNGVFVEQFGIKHGSKRDASHGWVARDLKLSPRFALNFANCSVSIDDMIRHLAEMGTIELEE